MNVDRVYHWLRGGTPLHGFDAPDDEDDNLFDHDLGDDDGLDDAPGDAPDDDDFDIPRDDLSDADDVPDDDQDEDEDDDDGGWAGRDHLVDDTEFETRGGATSVAPVINTLLVAYFVCDADVLSDAAGAAAFLQQLCGESAPYPTTVITADRGSNAGRLVAAALGLRIQTLTGLGPFDPDAETATNFDDRCRDALETIQSAGGRPVIVGSGSLTAYMAGVDVTDPRDNGSFSLLEKGGVLAITTSGLILLHRPNAGSCIDCANPDLPCPFHDDIAP